MAAAYEFSAPLRDGFTALELLLALGLAVLVVAIGLSAYETFSVRSEVAAGVAGVRELRRSIEAAYRRTGSVPVNTAALESVPKETGPLIGRLEVVDGRIDLVFGPPADAAIRGRRVSLTPYETVERDVVWVCGNAVPGVGLHPLGFAAGGRQAVQAAATIEPRYLPAQCR